MLCDLSPVASDLVAGDVKWVPVDLGCACLTGGVLPYLYTDAVEAGPPLMAGWVAAEAAILQIVLFALLR